LGRPSFEFDYVAAVPGGLGTDRSLSKLQLHVTRHARLRWIFIGPQGIRAGWSLLIFFTLLAPLDLIREIVKSYYPSLFTADPSPGDSLLIEAVQLFFVIGAMVITGRIEGRAVWSYYGLAGHRPIAKLLAGWAGGLICLSLVVGALFASRVLAFEGRALQGLPILGYGLVWLLVFLMVGVSEEVMYRGFLQATLTRALGFWPAAILVSIFFGVGHIGNPGETFVGVSGVMIRALFYCLLLRLTGSLWAGIGFHAAWDWAQTYLYGTPQSGHVMQGHLFNSRPLGAPLLSGGGVGPEGSLLWAPPFALGLLVFFWALRRLGLFSPRQTAHP
jgi:membrane protease YdiL (CAAX protease family)